MLWVKKKNNNDENLYKECLSLFSETKLNTTEKYDHDNIVKLIDEIRKFYKDKLDRKEISIQAERIRLEASIGKYSTNYSKNVTSLFIGMLSALCVLFIDKIGVFNDTKIQNISSYLSGPVIILIKLLSFLLIILYLMKLTGDRYTKIEKKLSIINNIKLQVLEDIEKEIEIKNKKEIINNEVAATVQKEQPKELIRPISQQTNGNWNVEINVPSIVDTFASIYKVGKFVTKKFRKKK